MSLEMRKIPRLSGSSKVNRDRNSFREVADKSNENVFGNNLSVVSGSHPLLQEYLLRCIFKFLTPEIKAGIPFEFQISLRRVCKAWNEVVSDIYRKRREAVCIGVQSPFEPRERRLLLSPDLKYVVQLITNSIDFPVARFTLGASLFSSRNLKLLTSFFELVGSQAVELTIVIDSRNFTIKFSRDALPKFQFNLMKKLKLELKGNRKKLSKSQVDSISEFVDFLFDVAKQMEQLTIQMEQFRKKDDVIGRLISKIVSTIPEKVRSLSLKCPLSDCDCELLAQHTHQITKLEIETTRLVNFDKLHSYLEKQSAYLTSLRLCKQANAPKSALLRFPHLPNLTFVQFGGNEKAPFSSFEKFPALQTMDLTHAKHFDFASQMLTSPIILQKKTIPPPLKEVYFPLFIDGTLLSPLAAKHLQNLSILRLGPSKYLEPTLKSVFRSLIQLEELYIFFTLEMVEEFNGDVLISGIDEYECDTIIVTRSFFDIPWENVQTQPSMSNLTNLKKLVMVDDYCNVIHTNITAVLLLRMPRLRHVKMSRSRITASFIAQLKDNLTMLELANDGYQDLEYESDVEWSEDIVAHGVPDLKQISLPGLGNNVFFNY